MAKGPYTTSDGRKYVIVESGDCLTQIAVDFKGRGTSGYSDYRRLAALNNISNVNKINVGDKIYLTGASVTTTTTTPQKVTITKFGRNSVNEKEMFVTWKWGEYKNTEKYKIVWHTTLEDTSGSLYKQIDEHENSVDEDVEAASRQDTFTIPDGAVMVQAKIKPISKEKDNSGGVYFTATWAQSSIFDTSLLPLSAPSTPSVEIDGLVLTASLDNISIDRATHIEFEVVKDNASSAYATETVKIVSSRASHQFAIEAGSVYKVRCRAAVTVYINGGTSVTSEWSSYSANHKAMPAAPGPIITEGEDRIRAISETSVYLAWGVSPTATSYEIQYTTESRYFDNSKEVSSQTDIKNTHWEVTGLETGKTYYFRVRAIDEDSKSESAWTDVESVAVGSVPAAPTTWSSTTTAIVGESPKLYWLHNSEDGSFQTLARLELYVDGVEEPYVYEFNNTDSVNDERVSYNPLSEKELESGTSNFCVIKTSIYAEGTKIGWRVQTAGVTNEYGDWSTQRTVEIYAPPTLWMNVYDKGETASDSITGFPIKISASAGPTTQYPISYHLSIASTDQYETTDNVGNPKIINEGDVVFSRHYDALQSRNLNDELSAGDLSLESTQSYKITCTVSMNTGLTAEKSKIVTVDWETTYYTPNAEILVDPESMTAVIRPYCESRRDVYYQVTYVNGEYVRGSTAYDYVARLDGKEITTSLPAIIANYATGLNDTSVDNVVSNNLVQITTYYLLTDASEGITVSTPGWTTTRPTVTVAYPYLWCYQEFKRINGFPTTTDGDVVYFGTTSDGDNNYYCVVNEVEEVTGATMDVYRREFDGSFVKINDVALDVEKHTSVTDPHPSLDYARYRIVAIDTVTGAVSYYDMPGHYIGGTSVILQWSESWVNFEVDTDGELVRHAWSGSMLVLPYNIDVSDSNSRDVSLVEYVGRENPVSYYGTQLGHQATWNVEVPKSDKETLYALRRLQRWMGDVYVREPSGSGYWASVSVSFSQKHCELTIPVTLSISRVEGGVYHA